MARQNERHGRLVALGLVGVRWTTAEIQRQPDLVAQRVRIALDASDHRNFRGWLRIGGQILKPKAVPPDIEN